MKNQQGFTLIELIIVIVILGIISVSAAPKFLNFSDDAEKASFHATAAAFRGGVKQVHNVWQIRGNGVAVLNLIPINDPSAGGDLSVNSFGYPADTRGSSLTMNSEDDCLDVWRAVLSSQDITVSGDDTGTYEATYSNFACTYTHTEFSSLTVTYDSTTGDITINGV